MQQSFMDQRQYIVVAVAFDEHTMSLAHAAAELCRKTGKKLCLAHVVEPWAELPTSRAFGSEDPLWNVTQAVEASARDLAEARFEEIVQTLGDDLTIRREIRSGKPAAELARIAEDVGAALMLVGADYGNLRFLPRGFSTAMSLMVSSPCPVCVIDAKAEKKFLHDPARFVLADDLGPESEAAVAFAYALAAAMDQSELHHVHVNGLSFETLKAGLGTATATAHTPLNAVASSEDVFDALLARLREKLEARAQPHREYLDAAGGTVVTEVLTGEVNEQVGALSASVEPDLLIFGRHQAYHTRPFFIGRLPFRQMLAQKRPIVIVPNA
jgi:nucleotide-binding universal stress UspA family protein